MNKLCLLVIAMLSLSLQEVHSKEVKRKEKSQEGYVAVDAH